MRVFSYIVMVCLLAPAALTQEPPPHSESKPNLTILMDENLILPTAGIARAYAKLSHTPLTTVVKNPDTESEISQGLEAHLILSADKELIDRLAAQGLTDVSSIRPFAQTSAKTRTGKLLEELTNTEPAADTQYYIAVLASESMEAARKFATFLDSKAAQDLLAKSGFESP